MDRGQATAHRLNPVQGGGHVFYASLPAPPEGSGANGEETRSRLVSILWDYRATTKNPPGKQGRSSSRAAFPIRLVRGPLGKPFLLSGDHRGPAISFSQGGGKLWVALCGNDSEIGIDAAGSDEFRGGYPVQRVFHPEELEHALGLTSGNREEASALLWSIKEALVKALGCAFHLVDPLQISIRQSSGSLVTGEGWCAFPVSLTGKALQRFPLATGRSLWVHSLPQRGMWLSIALVDRSLTSHA
ncbi:MAG: 4'-phosphopantetheinyl transferase superfamily protein [Desulfuromonadales bacterium]|nr:4'-phosphopantetheinyl transferase superfamily protein [Desulfuromonadales bacterium]